MGYSPCIGVNFGPYENALVFRILGVFWSGFLHTTFLMLSHNRFVHLLAVFNFWPKLTILHGLEPMYSGQFWPFWKCSHFSHIRCFLERFFAHNSFKKCCRTIVLCTFLLFLIFDPNWLFCMGYILASLGHFGNALVCPILGVFWSGFLLWTFLKWSHNRFSYVFSTLNFWQKLTILHGL